LKIKINTQIGDLKHALKYLQCNYESMRDLWSVFNRIICSIFCLMNSYIANQQFISSNHGGDMRSKAARYKLLSTSHQCPCAIYFLSSRQTTDDGIIVVSGLVILYPIKLLVIVKPAQAFHSLFPQGFDAYQRTLLSMTG